MSAVSTTVVAVDLGASSGRVLRGVLEGGRLSVRECARFANGPVRLPLRSAPPTGGGAGEEYAWDVLALWSGILDGLRVAAGLGPVDAVGIDSWAVDYALLDADSRLLGNPASYRSPRCAPAAAAVLAELDAQWLYERNGLQFQPFNTVFQLVADTREARASLARRALLIPDLLAYWLTGEAVTEVTNASTTGLLDPGARAWDPGIAQALLEGFGVEARFPRLVEAGAVVGPITVPGLGLRSPSGEATPLVAVGTHDTASAVVGVPADPDGGPFAFVSSGTWSLVGVELGAPVRTPEARLANFTNELGVDSTVRFLKNIMGMWVQQECLRQWRERGEGGLDWPSLDAQTEAAQPLRSLFDINAPEFLAPGGMIERIGARLEAAGEPVPTTRGELLRAVTESLVVAYRRALREAAELSGVAPATIHIVGGGSKNALLCQSTADATGIPVVAGPVEATALGNMLVQLRAVGAVSGGLGDMRRLVAASAPLARYAPRPGAAPQWERAEERVVRGGA